MYINLDGGNSDREVWTCALGGQLLRAEIAAREPQDSSALVLDGLNAIRRRVEAFGKRRSDELQAHRFYRNSDMQRSALRILSFHCGEAGTNLAGGSLEFVFYTASGRQEIESELARMQEEIVRELDGMQIDFSAFIPASRYFEYICADETDPSLRLLLDCASEVEGKTIRPAGACLTDYFLYLKHGSPQSVTYGILRDFKLPGGAHQPDEFVECRDLIHCTKALALYLLRWCGYERGKRLEQGPCQRPWAGKEFGMRYRTIRPLRQSRFSMMGVGGLRLPCKIVNAEAAQTVSRRSGITLKASPRGALEISSLKNNYCNGFARYCDVCPSGIGRSLPSAVQPVENMGAWKTGRETRSVRLGQTPGRARTRLCALAAENAKRTVRSISISLAY
jgi:hypothetical protein